MLKIRLQRVGRKKQPYFRFVLTDSKNSTKSGKFHEVLGFFDYRKGGEHKIDKARVVFWMSKGAQLTPSVHNYLVGEKIIDGKKINVLPRKSPPKPEEAKKEDKKTEKAAKVKNEETITEAPKQENTVESAAS